MLQAFADVAPDSKTWRLEQLQRNLAIRVARHYQLPSYEILPEDSERTTW